MTVRELRDEIAVELAAAGVEDATTDARLFLEEALHTSYAGFLMRYAQQVPPEVEEQVRAWTALRAKRIPLQQITGEAPFLGLSFIVTPAVLIPRADTETLATVGLECCQDAEVLDLCTGSGILAVTLAVRGKCAHVTASDISEDALAIARKNAERHNASVTFIQSDLFDRIPGRFDLIVSNPPYIPTDDIWELAPEVRDHDPHLALDGGSDGLSFYRRILGEVTDHLNPGGRLAVEIGDTQAEEVRALFEKAGLEEIRVIKDLSGLDRVVTGKYHV